MSLRANIQSTPETRRKRAVLYLMAAAWIFYGFGYDTLYKRYALELNGTVISSTDTPAKGASRYSTVYVFKSDDGREENYTAGPTDADIERSLAVGSKIQKKSGELGYIKNDKWVDFPFSFYSVLIGIAVGLLFRSIALFSTKNPN